MERRETVNIILVGSNPLPCYVQAAYLMEPGRDGREEMVNLPVPDLHILVYTEETETFKDNIAHALCKKYALQQDREKQERELEKTYDEAYRVQKNMKRKISNWEKQLMQTENYLTYRNGAISEIKLSDINNPVQIMNDLEASPVFLENACLENARKVILNNTGGTKTMATYVTLWLQKKISSSGCLLTECYVNDREKKLCCYIYGGAEEPKFELYPQGKPLTDVVVLRIPEIARLYGFEGYSSKEPYFAADENRRRAVLDFAGKIFDSKEEKSHFYDEGKEKTRPYYERYAELLSRYLYLQNMEIKKYFKGLCVGDAQYLFETSQTDQSDKKKSDLGQIIKETEPFLYKNSRDVANDLKRILYETDTAKDQSRKSETEKKSDDAQPFLDETSLRLLKGEWLEAYLYIAVAEAIEKKKKRDKRDIDLAWSVVISEKGNGNKSKDFELDVVACVGYELKIFSITIDETQGTGKLKYFEALFRGEVISGSHSQVIAVNLIDKNDEEMRKFKDDLQSFGSVNYRQAEVWGKQDISDYKKLVEKIGNILDK